MGKKEGKVILDMEVYWATIAATVRYASARIPEPEWREFYGILLGKIEDKINLHVTQAIPMTHTKNIGHVLRVQFEDEDYVAAVAIEDEAIAERGEFRVGWVHSHPGIKVMFSQDDIKTQLGMQNENNPLAIGIVFNQKRLLNQAEMPAKKGDPLTQLQNDPGFEIYRLDDPDRGIQASYHKVQYEFNSPKSLTDIVQQGKIFVEEATQFFPRDNPDKHVAEDIQKSIEVVNSAVVGLEEYSKTLTRQGQASRIKEVVATQQAEIDEIIRTRNERIEKQRRLFNYVEYKERETVIPNVQQAFKKWEDTIVAIKPRIEAILAPP